MILAVLTILVFVIVVGFLTKRRMQEMGFDKWLCGAPCALLYDPHSRRTTPTATGGVLSDDAEGGAGLKQIKIMPLHRLKNHIIFLERMSDEAARPLVAFCILIFGVGLSVLLFAKGFYFAKSMGWLTAP